MYYCLCFVVLKIPICVNPIHPVESVGSGDADKCKALLFIYLCQKDICVLSSVRVCRIAFGDDPVRVRCLLSSEVCIGPRTKSLNVGDDPSYDPDPGYDN